MPKQQNKKTTTRKQDAKQKKSNIMIQNKARQQTDKKTNQRTS